MNYQELSGKSLALLLVGEDENRWILHGTVCREGEALLLDHSASEQPFKIQPEWLDRIKPVPADLRDIFKGADFFLPLSMGTLPEDADPSEYVDTGLKLTCD